MSAIRVLKLDDDNHTPSYHCEDTAEWYNADEFIKFLTRPHTIIIPYEVRTIRLVDIEISEYKPEKIDHYFDIVQFNRGNRSFEEYQEAFDILWKIGDDI